MSESPLPEPLEKFLQNPPGEGMSAAVSDKVLADTTALLTKRRGWRRWPIASAVAAGLAAAFVAGYLVGRNHEPELDPMPNVKHVDNSVKPAPKAPAPREEEPTPVPAKILTALELEWKAFDAADDMERGRLYFQAGDIYLVKHQDYASASRCYHEALEVCDPNEREVTA